jgi:hypothetical protein
MEVTVRLIALYRLDSSPSKPMLEEVYLVPRIAACRP